jgi:hypothetical protein
MTILCYFKTSLVTFGDPDSFVWFYFKYIINSIPGKFQHILISGTITAELP